MCFGCGRTKDEICEYNTIMFQQEGTFGVRSSYATNPNAWNNPPQDSYQRFR